MRQRLPYYNITAIKEIIFSRYAIVKPAAQFSKIKAARYNGLLTPV